MTTIDPDCQVAQFMFKLLDDPLINEPLKQSHISMCPRCLMYNRIKNREQQEKEEV